MPKSVSFISFLGTTWMEGLVHCGTGRRGSRQECHQKWSEGCATKIVFPTRAFSDSSVLSVGFNNTMRMISLTRPNRLFVAIDRFWYLGCSRPPPITISQCLWRHPGLWRAQMTGAMLTYPSRLFCVSDTSTGRLHVLWTTASGFISHVLCSTATALCSFRSICR